MQRGNVTCESYLTTSVDMKPSPSPGSKRISYAFGDQTAQRPTSVPPTPVSAETSVPPAYAAAAVADVAHPANVQPVRASGVPNATISPAAAATRFVSHPST